MTVVIVQHGSWPGWPGGVAMELESNTAAAILTAARDYQAEKHVDLKGDLLALPAGGLRPAAWIADMQWAFDHRHDTGANKTKSLALYAHYNMDPTSNARPATSSTHALGICGDIANNGFLAWLKAGNAKRYGLVFTLSPPLSNLNDLRHCQFFPGTATVALDVTSLDNDQQQEVLAMDNTVRLYQEIDANNNDVNNWSRIGPGVLPVGTPGQPGYFPGGYEATDNHDTAVLWGLYAPDGSSPIKRQHDAYVAEQQFGAKQYQLQRADEIARIKEAVGTITGGAGATTAQVAAAVDAILKDDFAALAKQEGTDQAALLTAISQVDENTLATFGLKRA